MTNSSIAEFDFGPGVTMSDRDDGHPCRHPAIVSMLALLEDYVEVADPEEARQLREIIALQRRHAGHCN